MRQLIKTYRQNETSLSLVRGRGMVYGKGLWENVTCPIGQFLHILFKYRSINHPEKQTCLLIINGVVINIRAVYETAHTLTVKDRLIVAHIMAAFHHPSGNARGVDGRMICGYGPSNDNKNWFVNSGYHATEIFWASSRICSKKRVVASSFVRLASSAASFINCERTASEGSSKLVNRYVSIVGFITMFFILGGKDTK